MTQRILFDGRPATILRFDRCDGYTVADIQVDGEAIQKWVALPSPRIERLAEPDEVRIP